jgi:hypothetical protein
VAGVHLSGGGLLEHFFGLCQLARKGPLGLASANALLVFRCISRSESAAAWPPVRTGKDSYVGSCNQSSGAWTLWESSVVACGCETFGEVRSWPWSGWIRSRMIDPRRSGDESVDGWLLGKAAIVAPVLLGL